MTGPDSDKHLDCDDARVLVSALADGEATAHEQQQLTQHLETCADCATYSARVQRVDRLVRVRPAEPVPDLVASVTARVRPPRLGRGGWLRPALAWVAIVLLVQSLPALVLGDVAGSSAHQARHLGAFGAALAIGFAFAAWRPHRAFGLLPFTAALVATTAVSVIADIASGTRTPMNELVHMSELVGLVLLWVIAGSPGWHGRRPRSRASLRLTRLDPL